MNEDKLKELIKPFPEHQISKLPKSTKKQTEDLKANRSLGKNCSLCFQWHHKDTVHLDYVGHAALTSRLLEVDPLWNWEPLAKDADGLPKFDQSGGLWIKLTVCGFTRLGYGHAEKSNFKEIGAREKEVIGDALRNAAMRFGAALDLWHKGDLHIDDEDLQKKDSKPINKATSNANDEPIYEPEKITAKQVEELRLAREKAKLSQEDVVSMIRQTFNKENVKDLQRFELSLLVTMVKKRGKELEKSK